MPKAKTKIPVMKNDDFVEDKGTIKNTLKRGVKINDKSSNLKATYSMNHKKGLVGITIVIDNDQIVTDDPVQNEATLLSALGLGLAAINKGLEFRKQWKKDNAGKENDDNQLPMGFDED